MLIAYYNYPNAAVTIHADPRCGHIRSRQKEKQRSISISLGTLSRELGHVVNKEYQFGATAEINDMWVQVETGDRDFDRAVVDLIRSILGKRYKRFRDSKIYLCKCGK